MQQFTKMKNFRDERWPISAPVTDCSSNKNWQKMFHKILFKIITRLKLQDIVFLSLGSKIIKFCFRNKILPR